MCTLKDAEKFITPINTSGQGDVPQSSSHHHKAHCILLPSTAKVRGQDKKAAAPCSVWREARSSQRLNLPQKDDLTT